MWTKILKSSFLLGLFLIAFRSFAIELSLEDLRKEVMDENLDIKVQYEKYYQAQKSVGVALGEFLPGVSISLVNVNATLAILQSVVPTPGNWFAYQASKELSLAEKFTTESIKLNILEGLTEHYINIKFQESMMLSLKDQDTYLETIYLDAKKKEEIGMASADDVFAARRKLLKNREDIYLLDTLMIAEKQALLIALNRAPTEDLTLGAVPGDHLEKIPATVEEGIKLAFQNSTELISNDYQTDAAYYMVNSKKYSFIGFDGIGFGYASTLAIEKSRARIIELQREQIELKIANQVQAAYHELSIYDQRIELQKSIIDSIKILDQRNQELYDLGTLSLAKYIESKINVTGEYRVLNKLMNERRIKIAQLNRYLGLDASLNDVDRTQYDAIQLVTKEQTARRGAKKIWLSLEMSEELKNDVFSVTYSVPGVFAASRVLDSTYNFTYYYKFSKAGSYQATAKIKLKNGDVIERETTLTVE